MALFQGFIMSNGLKYSQNRAILLYHILILELCGWSLRLVSNLFLSRFLTNLILKRRKKGHILINVQKC